VLDERDADDLARARHHVEHPRRDPRLERELGEAERREGRRLGGLYHRRVAEGERRRGLPRRDREREVPRYDERAHAKGLSEGEPGPGRREGHRLAPEGPREARVVLETVRAERDLVARLADRLADVPGFERCELVGVLPNEVGEPKEHARALGGSGAPGALLERAAGRADRGVDVVGAGFGHDALGATTQVSYRSRQYGRRRHRRQHGRSLATRPGRRRARVGVGPAPSSR
jgi:hypothetical protein